MMQEVLVFTPGFLSFSFFCFGSRFPSWPILRCLLRHRHRRRFGLAFRITHRPQIGGAKRPHLRDGHFRNAAFGEDPPTNVLRILVHHHPRGEIRIRLSGLCVSRNVELERSAFTEAQMVFLNVHHHKRASRQACTTNFDKVAGICDCLKPIPVFQVFAAWLITKHISRYFGFGSFRPCLGNRLDALDGGLDLPPLAGIRPSSRPLHIEPADRPASFEPASANCLVAPAPGG